MELKEAREQIDQIDRQLTDLFVKRMEVAQQVAEYKREHGLPVLDRERERQVIASRTAQAGEEMATYTRVLYNTLMDLSRSYQSGKNSRNSSLPEKIKGALERTPQQFPVDATVACQGVEGAYSQIACDKLFRQASITYFRTWEGVFQAVDKGLCRYGVLPIENSTAGSVNQVYDLMNRYRFHIARGIRLRVEHTLLARPGVTLGEITEVYSHEQAIHQCGHFLKDHPSIKVHVCENTAAAAQMVAQSERRDVAAISSRDCGALYGLTALGDSIQDNANNYTRFICISKELEIYPGANKTSMMLSIPHKPGSLYQIISKFASLDLNLTKLESRPIPGKDFEFMFYFDIDASIYAPETVELVAQLDEELERFTYLGSYLEQ